MSEEEEQKAKEEDEMSAYVKPIQATPTLTGEDAMRIIKQAVTAPSPESIERNKKMLEMRKRIVQK